MKLRVHAYDDDILFSNMEKREKEDIQDFIKYRNRLYRQRIISEEIVNLQRALNIAKNYSDQSQENRIINLWAVLEYILTFHEGTSIIAKVKDIIPKIVCLYFVKDKINSFWFRLNNVKRNESVDEFLKKCRVDDADYYYDLDKFLDYIQSKGPCLIDEFIFNDILMRDIAEIGYLINDKNRKSCIEKRYMEVSCDLVRIYRTRNILIHSRHRNSMNLNYKSLRLYQYINHLLGVIIYYKNKNPHFTITEILNSIEYTYKEYIDNIGKDDITPKQICKPEYLFL